MRSAGIGITCPICVHPTPEYNSLLQAASKKDAFIKRAAEIPEHVVSCGHVQLARASCQANVYNSRELYIFAQFGIGESQIRAGHINEASQTAYNAAIAGMKSTVRMHIAIMSLLYVIED
jgi:hypothetical protein